MTTHIYLYEGRTQLTKLSLPMEAKLVDADENHFTVTFRKDGRQQYTYLPGAGFVPSNP